jgi:hypothetical protein
VEYSANSLFTSQTEPMSKAAQTIGAIMKDETGIGFVSLPSRSKRLARGQAENKG